METIDAFAAAADAVAVVPFVKDVDAVTVGVLDAELLDFLFLFDFLGLLGLVMALFKASFMASAKPPPDFGGMVRLRGSEGFEEETFAVTALVEFVIFVNEGGCVWFAKDALVLFVADVLASVEEITGSFVLVAVVAPKCCFLADAWLVLVCDAIGFTDFGLLISLF